MKVLSHSLIASLVVATILTAGEASTVATEEFVVPGSCPFVDELKLWNEQKEHHWKLGGNWYWHSYTPNPYQPIEKCVKMRLQYDAESTFRTYASGLDSNGEPIKTQGMLYPKSVGGPKFTIAHEKAPPAPVVVLDTDYQNYACLYSCQDFGGRYHGDFGFVYSRTPKMDPAYSLACDEAFSKIGMELTRFIKAYQEDDCP